MSRSAPCLAGRCNGDLHDRRSAHQATGPYMPSAPDTALAARPLPAQRCCPSARRHHVRSRALHLRSPTWVRWPARSPGGPSNSSSATIRFPSANRGPPRITQVGHANFPRMCFERSDGDVGAVSGDSHTHAGRRLQSSIVKGRAVNQLAVHAEADGVAVIVDLHRADGVGGEVATTDAGVTMSVALFHN